LMGLPDARYGDEALALCPGFSRSCQFYLSNMIFGK
jgi:hypothetical protein